MGEVIFNYPGGKSHLCNWIIDNMADHECYAEPFCGSAAVLLNKPRSEVEVINDLDSDIIDFFRVYREKHDELIEWLDDVPYSRELYVDWAEEFYYEGYRPDDPIKRAGRFFFLRYSQFGSKYSGKSGFGVSKVQNQAQTFKNKVENLKEFKQRLDGVIIENLDWMEMVERYDGEGTYFYCDPPYVGTEGYYMEDSFSHTFFVEIMKEVDGFVAISYDSVPEIMNEDDWMIFDKESKNYIDSGIKGENKDTTELLIMNYDPKNTKPFNTSRHKSISTLLQPSETTDNEVTLDNVSNNTNKSNEDTEEGGFLENV